MKKVKRLKKKKENVPTVEESYHQMQEHVYANNHFCRLVL